MCLDELNRSLHFKVNSRAAVIGNFAACLTFGEVCCFSPTYLLLCHCQIEPFPIIGKFWEQLCLFGNSQSYGPTVSVVWPPLCLGCCKRVGELWFGCDRTCFHFRGIAKAAVTRILSAGVTGRRNQSQRLLQIRCKCCSTCQNAFFLASQCLFL